MADLLIVTPSPVVLTLGATYSAAIGLDLRLAIDISRWDVIDLSVGLLSISTTATFTIDFLSAMQMDNEDASWGLKLSAPPSVVGTLAFTGPVSAPLYQSVSLPGSSAMLRYLRWRVYASSGAPTVSFVISGLGRRKGS